MYVAVTYRYVAGTCFFFFDGRTLGLALLLLLLLLPQISLKSGDSFPSPLLFVTVCFCSFSYLLRPNSDLLVALTSCTILTRYRASSSTPMQ